MEDKGFLPTRRTLSGIKPSTFKDLEISFPWFRDLKVLTSIENFVENKSQNEVYNSSQIENDFNALSTKAKFEYFSWMKTFVGHKDPEKISDTAAITAITSHLHYLITGSSDKLIKVWDVNTGMLEFTFHGHLSRIIQIVVKDTTVFSQCQKKLIIWHLYTASSFTELLIDSPSTNLLIINAHFFITCMKSGQVSIYDLEEEGDDPKICELDLINVACITSDLKYLITSGNSHLQFWDLNDFGLSCDYATKSSINQIKCSRFGNFIATGGKDFSLWRFSQDQILKFWENNCEPFRSSYFSIPGSGQFEWCGMHLIFSLDSKEETSEIHCKSPDFLDKTDHPCLILSLKSNENLKAIAGGDCEGHIVLWSVPDLEKIFSFKETGNLSLLHGHEISINHLEWLDDTLITGSNKGTHSLYGFSSSEHLTFAPIQQFFSIDYLSEFTKNLTFCDFKLSPYKYQPKLSMFYRRKGFKNNSAKREDLYKYFHMQELQAANEFFFEEDVMRVETDRESESERTENSVHSVLEFNSDLSCFRCQRVMMDSNKWCNECGKTFHAACFDKFKGIFEEEICLICFKASKSCKEIKTSLRNNIRQSENGYGDYQVGDRVVFVLQAYEEYLRQHPDVPILDNEIFFNTLPTVMQIANIEYLWPAQGLISVVSESICRKIHLLILGSSTKTFIYLVESEYKFLIYLPEYLEKLRIFEDNPTQITIETSSGIELEEVIDLSPNEPELELSPYKTIILSTNQRISFWESGNFTAKTISTLRKPNLSKFTSNISILTKPTTKNFKLAVAYPLSLKTIEERISSNYYKSKSSVLYDLQILKDNTLEFFGKASSEGREICRIYESLRKEINETVVDPSLVIGVELSEEFQIYLPHNHDKLPSVQESTQNRFKKLRRLN